MSKGSPMNLQTNCRSKIGFRLVKRTELGFWGRMFVRVAAVSAALAITGLVLALSGISPLEAAIRVLESTLGTKNGWNQALRLATPIIICGLSVAVGMAIGLFNVGAEGQLYIGAWAAAAIGLHFNLPVPIMFITIFIAGAFSGLLLILIPALAYIHGRISLVLSTLIFNYIAIFFVQQFTLVSWRDISAGTMGATHIIPYSLGPIWGPLISVIIATILYFLLNRTVWGYEARTIGGNWRAAEFAGIPVLKRALIIILISGAISGIAGVVQVTGTIHRLSAAISNGYGYQGLTVAMLANGSVPGIVIVGFLFAILLNGGIVLQAQGLSVNAVIAITGLILIFSAVGEVGTRYKISFK